ncbi:MAG: polysaccharide biosynthesis/export family protein [Gemmataceae bacterium]
MNPVNRVSQRIVGTRIVRYLFPALIFAFLVSLCGCAAITNPVADGIPVRKVPPEYLGIPREQTMRLPEYFLGQPPADPYEVAPGDTLAVYVLGVTGDPNQLPPVTVEASGLRKPALGYPYPVRSDGTLKLPKIDPLDVDGKTLTQIEQEVTKAYIDAGILKKENINVNVDLLKPRTERIIVIREDSGSLSVSPTGVLGNASSGQGFVVDLAAYENDVLHALAQTGGLPGLDAKEEVIVQKGYLKEGDDPNEILDAMRMCRSGMRGFSDPNRRQNIQIVRIPLRLNPGERVTFKPKDVILKTGDVVFIASRRTEVFYTGGLLSPNQFPLPRDVDLRVIDAIALARGPFLNGLITQNNLAGNVAQLGIGSPSPSLVTVLRKTKRGGQIPIKVDLYRAARDPRENILIKPGDVLILQETVDQAMTRYFTGVIRFPFFSEILNTPTSTIDVTGVAP